MSKFIIRLTKYGIIDTNTIVDLIQSFEKIKTMILEEDKLEIVEELVEISCTLYLMATNTLKPKLKMEFYYYKYD